MAVKRATQKSSTPKKKTSQATKAAVNKALGRVGSGKARPVTIAQVQNDPTIKASEKKAIIKVLRQSTEG